MQAQGADLVLQRMADDSLYVGIFQSLLWGEKCEKKQKARNRWRQVEKD